MKKIMIMLMLIASMNIVTPVLANEMKSLQILMLLRHTKSS